MMKRYSLKSHNRRKHQRWLNNYIREWNKSIKQDDLWLGRFVIEQKSTWMEWFEDKSGGLLPCALEFVDRKTGHTQMWYTDCLEVTWHYWWELNRFIVEDCYVWHEDPDPYENRIDFRAVK